MDKFIKATKLFFILSFLVLFLNCSSTTKNQQPDNTKPMYGEVSKNEQYQAIDEQFIKDCVAQFGSIDNALFAHLDFAWSYFYHDDLTTAMKRFNQAWLLNPEFPDAYFGFAALLEMQNNTAEAARFYKIGLEKDISHKRAEICYKIIADCKNEIRKIRNKATESDREL